MRRTNYAAGKGPSPGWRKLVVLAGLLALIALLTRAARAQDRPEDRDTLYVSAVKIHGLRTVSEDQVLPLLQTKAGKEYNVLTAKEDLSRLYQTRWFRSVQPVRLRKTDKDNQVIVDFIVEEHPNVVREIIYKNAHHAKPADLDGVTNIHRGSPLNPSQNLRACYDIQDYFKKKGYLLCSVHLEEGGKAGDQRVVFNITEGGKVRIRQIRFTGNDTLATQARLRTQIDSKQPLLPGGGLGLIGEYNPAAVEHDQLKLQDYYKSNGYLDARVTREVILNEDLHTVDVIFHINEGLRYRVQDVSVEGPKQVDRDLVRSVIRVKQGDHYNEPAVEADMRTITDLYGFRGYGVMADKKLTYADKNTDPGLVRVDYQVMERGPYKVGQVQIVGNTVTKDRVIRRVLQVYPGQVLSYPLLRQGEKDLQRLGIFETNPDKGTKPTIIVKEDPDNPDSPYRDLEVHVAEQPTGSLMFGLGVNSNAGLMGSIVLNEKNFDILRPPTSLDDIFNGRAWRGGGQEFRAEAVPGTVLQRYTVSFREPFLFDRPISLSTSAYYYQRYYNEYNEERIGTRLTLGKQLNRYWSVAATARVEQVGVSGVLPWAPPDLLNAQGHHLLAGPRIGVIRDDRDSFLRPTQGGMVEAAFEQIFGSYTFPIVTVEGSRYFTTYQRPDGSGRHVIALRSQLGFTGSNTPVFERFYAGGFNSLRGFQFRGVGPSVNGFMIGGDFMFLNTVEYQVPIKANDQFYVVAFVDHGTVESNVSLQNYRVSAGFGVRLTVPMLGPVPIAIDFGFPIMRAPSDRTQVVAFYIGMFK